MLNFPQLEEKILAFWKEKDIFNKTLEKDSPKGDFIFYDGPPFATGLPHYGHIVASLMKDMVPRYFTMKGYHVDRKWGWDCHGLPIENIVEKELGLKHKKDIENYGVAKFNETCESKVFLYAAEWRKTVERMGRWVDMDNDYKTMDRDFMESVWWVFKQLWDKDLIYQSRRSIHICPRCETTLSQSEVGQGYKDVKDISATAKFELIDEPNTFVLAWTTTPWTLPGNLALAVGKDIDYIELKIKDSKLKIEENLVVAKNTASKLFSSYQIVLFKEKEKKIIIRESFNSEDIEIPIVKEFKGSELVGKKYKPLFDYYQNKGLENEANGWTIYAGDFVSTEEGTGIVHIAPGFGEDDFNFGKEYNLPFVQHVGMDGCFTPEIIDFAGQAVKPKGEPTKTDKTIVEYLSARNLLFKSEEYEHSYPHCWRCDSPLLNYTTASWFVAVEKIKDDLLKKAKNINWMPDHIKDGRFGKWLEGARDWSISRQRYWGSVMPIWRCDHCSETRVFGSIEELEKASGKKVDNLHKHVVDQVVFPCSKCGGQMTRISDVLDCWFESGSMPYAQLHYPFENKEKFDNNFPAQFIAEGADQTRCWFYYLHVLAVAIKGTEAFSNVVVNGIVLASDGKKMSKRLKNYPDPTDIFNKYGADAMRYYLATSPAMRADDLCFMERDVENVVKKVLLTLANVVSFYKMYANELTNNKSQTTNHILDKWILAKTDEAILQITNAYDVYDLNRATRPLAEFINDLSAWYLRRSRDRFKGDDAEDKQSALITIKTVLNKLALLMAPVMPFTADWLYQEVGGEKESVHLEAWPEAKSLNSESDKTLQLMETARKIVELAFAKRDEANIKVRQTLASLTVTGAELAPEFLEIIKDEVNIKQVKCVKGETLSVVLDTVLTPELKAEGLLREIVRTVNQMRKDAGLTINDRIKIYAEAEEAGLAFKVFTDFESELKKSTLSSEILVNQKNEEVVYQDFTLNNEAICLAVVLQP